MFSPYTHHGIGTPDYMCPYCVTPWKCNGPHIYEDDLPQYNADMRVAYEQGLEDARDAVAALSIRHPTLGLEALRLRALAAIDALTVRIVETSGHDAPHLDPCDCDECRSIVMHNYDSEPDLPNEDDVRKNEPPVGAVVRCTGCGNVYIHKPHGWWNTDDGSTSPSLDGIKRPSCGPLRVIYNPEEGK